MLLISRGLVKGEAASIDGDDSRVRDARPGDLPELVALEAKLFTHDRLSRRSFRHLLARPTARVLIAERDGRLVGYALVLFRRDTPSARLYSIGRENGAAARGTGTALLTAAERVARERGAREMRLEVRSDNGRAIELYLRAGFQVCGHRSDYYEDRCDAVRMKKQLA